MPPVVRPESLAICARVAAHGLISAECDALVGAVPDDDGIAGGASAGRLHLVERAAYVQTGVRVIAHAESLDALVDDVAVTDFDADRFRIDVHDPSSRLGLGSPEVATRLADVIAFGPDLRDPMHRFLVTSSAAGVSFGEVVAHTDAGYRAHESKPWTTSSSLDPRFSRALVNLVPEATSIIDPCCGAGSIVLEAAALGLGAIGVDWKAAMAGMTRENLAHFGYEAHVDRADSRTTAYTADAVVTDLPYGHAIDSDEATVRSILERGASMAPVGVYVAPHDLSDWLVAAGHRVDAVHTVLKRRGFTRWIHVTRSSSMH